MPYTQLPAYSSSNFQLIFSNALRAYEKHTNNDLTALPFTTQLDACDSPAAIVSLLRQQAQQLDQSRSGNEGLSNRLGPTVNVLYAFSTTLRENLGLAFLPAAAVFTGFHVLLLAAKNIDSQDTLVDIFERLEHFFRRLEIYIEIPPTPEMMDTIVQVMVEMLSILGIATKEIKKRRMRKYVTKLLGRTDLEDALSRLDKLTQEEARMAAAEALKVMHTADERVRGVAEQVLAIDDRVAYLEARVADVNHTVTGAEEMALSPDNKAANAGNRMSDVDNKVASVSDGLKGVDSMMVHFDDRVKAINEKLSQVMDDGNEAKRVLKQVKPRLWENIYKWLSPPDPSPNHNIAFKARHKGTGTWFLQGSVFQQWKKMSSLLWIYGKPGSGKSILCSTIIQDIRAMCEAGQALMAYFYFDFRDVNKQHLRDLLLSLLVQLTAHSNPRCDILLRLYEAHNSGTMQPSDTVLETCLQEILTLSDHRPIYLIMDALDECPDTSGRPSPREQVLQLVEELVHLYLPNLHICITSRPEFDIRAALEPLTAFQVSLHDEYGQRADIEEYIKSIIYSDSERIMRRWKNEDKDLVIATLSKRADGMYQWVSCMFEMLRRCLPPSIRSTLAELPEVLDETYERVLKEIQKSNRDQAHRLFQCLVAAIRPLRVEELAEVLAVDFSHPSGIPRLNPNLRWEDEEQALLASCSTLITIVNSDKSRVVQFAHFSVKEYLTSPRLAASTQDVSRYYIAHEPAHTTLAQACLSTLLQSGGPIKDSPLAAYAAQNWVAHAQVENVSSYVREAMEYLFDLDRPYFGAWLRLHDIDSKHRSPATFDTSYPPEISDARPLYYAALCGFDSLTEYLISKYPKQVNTHCGYYVTPLAAALAGNHLGVAELLLKHGADPDVRGDHGETPLHVVSREGNLTVARRLLELGVDVNSRDNQGRTPLLHAVEWRNEDVCLFLLERGANTNVQDDHGETPLYVALRKGNLKVVRRLLQLGVDVNSRDNHVAANFGDGDPNAGRDHSSAPRVEDSSHRDSTQLSQSSRGWTPLHAASAEGQYDVARLLLERGADVNALASDHYKSGWTSLHFASQQGYVEVVQLLLNRQPDVDMCNEENQTALHLASQNGNSELMRLLIDHQANPNAEDEDNETPLFQASKNGRVEATRLLLERGATVDHRDWQKRTPLHAASENGHVDIARLLLHYNAEVDAQNVYGWTPLHFGSRTGIHEFAEILLDRGAEVNAQNNSGWTPLHMASQKGHLDVVRLLLNRGAVVDTREVDGETALHLASYYGHHEIAEVLLKFRADRAIENKEGKTPFDLATSEDHKALAQLLMLPPVDEELNAGAVRTAGKRVEGGEIAL